VIVATSKLFDFSVVMLLSFVSLVIYKWQHSLIRFTTSTRLERHIKLNFIPFETRIIGLLIPDQISYMTPTCDVKTRDDQLQLVCIMKWINQFKTNQKNVLTVAMKVITEEIVYLDSRIILCNVVLIKYFNIIFF